MLKLLRSDHLSQQLKKEHVIDWAAAWDSILLTSPRVNVQVRTNLVSPSGSFRFIDFSLFFIGWAWNNEMVPCVIPELIKILGMVEERPEWIEPLISGLQLSCSRVSTTGGAYKAL